jgi:hypothetical protein
MCQKCIFRVQKFPKPILIYRDKVVDWDRNQFQTAARALCKHDRKRFAFAQRYAEKDWMPIAEFLRIGLDQDKPFVPWADLLLNYGQNFRTPDCSEHVTFDEFSLGNCFGMAYALCGAEPAMQYAEGLSWSFPEHLHEVPLWHAWNVNPKGGVIDLTWPTSHWNEYFGIIFDLKWVKENCVTECGIFHPKNWPHNEERVRHYLNLQWLETASAR